MKLRVPRKGVPSRTHGASKTREFWVWRNMINRCAYPSSVEWHRYGGRGITICERWRFSFENFIVDMGLRPSSRHSLDRINNDGNYEPANCRWATREEQFGNTSRAKRITHDGRTLAIRQWARVMGVAQSTLQARLQRGMSFAQAICPARTQGCPAHAEPTEQERSEAFT